MRFEILNSYYIFEIDLKQWFEKRDYVSTVIMLSVVAVVANSTVYKNRRASILYLILNRKLQVSAANGGGFSTNLLLGLSVPKSPTETFVFFLLLRFWVFMKILMKTWAWEAGSVSQGLEATRFHWNRRKFGSKLKTSPRVENALHFCFAFVQRCHSPSTCVWIFFPTTWASF